MSFMLKPASFFARFCGSGQLQKFDLNPSPSPSPSGHTVPSLPRVTGVALSPNLGCYLRYPSYYQTGL